MGALEPCASSTIRTIWASAVSLPIFVALNLKAPNLLIVAPTTESPIFLSTGRLSPVSIDSSIVELPSTITPSTGTFSPGLTRRTSPTTTSSIGISNSCSSRTTRAVFACNPISDLMAAEVWPLALASNSLPRIIRVISTAELSKYRSALPVNILAKLKK
ncbi:hypothetical protein SDC9_70769 [bioreactor metagenome]|uniref:Uncharacterized protein n=1 Tax=bioreactor metagenome TaxID=1076179 RepID=A0A644Y8M9_9ZZZZ